MGPEGTLDTFTIIATAFPGLPKPPIIMAYVTLDHADTALINLVTGLNVRLNAEDIEVVAKKLNKLPRVCTKFIDKPTGRITDFSFELL